ncbi:hypothetical protein CPU12_13785 [Malaciobacter molluscorum LMG 25693]|uniref:Uncharacterized protein n=1 Tax=Malaciobacter molluscorum LMG 25693 TaxID=870501 RepID=A0A2G1DE62_9BACT|nr:hypothetical protein CPU12_13785 [Malaciobacter molluscorum LMG 25693]
MSPHGSVGARRPGRPARSRLPIGGRPGPAGPNRRRPRPARGRALAPCPAISEAARGPAGTPTGPCGRIARAWRWSAAGRQAGA